ncbi:MAG TPA: F0F1 ATP synthase subunit B [Clostridiaceae bacterium]|jgi:F-type H+-transporting ATPase subunit b|nr:F0F1 ATP synthase subunit B [Clostridiaceae bacterium]
MSNLLSGWTFIFTIINFIILYLVLKRFLFKPVTAYMEKRTNSIKESIKKAEDANREAENLKMEYDKKLNESAIQADMIIREAKEKARKEYDEIIKEARREAENIKARGLEEIEKQREQMMKEIKKEASALIFAAVEKLIDANIDSEKNRKLVEKFLNESDVA